MVYRELLMLAGSEGLSKDLILHPSILLLLQNLCVLRYVGAEKKAEWGRHWIEKGFNGEVQLEVKGWVESCALGRGPDFSGDN